MQYKCIGVWQSPSEIVDVTAMDVTITGTNGRKGLIAAAYSNGGVRVYNYPCQNFGVRELFIILPSSFLICFYFNLLQGQWVEVNGCSSFAPAAKFSVDGSHIILLDACSRSIIQYRIVR
jgi:hypothetical protein